MREGKIDASLHSKMTVDTGSERQPVSGLQATPETLLPIANPILRKDLRPEAVDAEEEDN
jgi:hypothetical protein